MRYEVRPIGYVKKGGSRISIEIEPEFREAAVQLDEFSHAIVLWWIHERDTPEDRMTLTAHPPRGKGDQASGVFACRSPSRPNPIGHSVVAILSVDTDTGIIMLDQIDAMDETPVLDIKPYLPSSDRVDDAVVAPWFANLEKRYSA